MNKLIVITGPTAVGKTKSSLAVAEELDTEIINGDAYQIYKGMDIGTAKPTPEELKKVVHHLIDFISPSEEYNVSLYQKEVRSIIDKMIEEKKVPLIVGGSGLYLESVFLNYTFKEETKEKTYDFSNYSDSELYNKLIELDKEVAETIHPNNRKRVERAIIKSLEKSNSPKLKDEYVYDTLVIFLNDDRDRLYERINNRVDEMINAGLVDECKKLYQTKLSKTSKAAIGYKEIFSYLDGECSLEEAIEKIKLNSRHYAKRQLTWFRNKPYVKEVMIDSNNFNNTIDELKDLINDFLTK